MEVATYILFVLGILGGTDILLYHSISHGIRTHQDSRQELFIHSLRGPTYALLFTVVPNFALHGLFFWLLIAIYFLDLLISLADFAIERASREFFGGLPTGEYVLHILLAMLFGGLVTSTFYGAGSWGALPTSITYEPAHVPALLRGLLVFMAVFVLYSGALDLRAMMRLKPAGTRELSHD